MSQVKVTKESAPHEPALWVRSLAWKIRAAANFFRIEEIDARTCARRARDRDVPSHNSLRFTALRQDPLFPLIFLHSLTGFRGGKEKTLLIVIPSGSEESFFGWIISRCCRVGGA